MASNSKPANPDWLVPGYPALKGEVGQAAVNGQLFWYPKVARSNNDPPVPGQRMALVSYTFFDRPKVITDSSSEKPIYGFVKVRGIYPDDDTAHNAASAMVRKVDSKHRIGFLPVGHWGPITENLMFFQDMFDVKMQEKEVTLRDRASLDKRKQDELLAKELEENLKEAQRYDIYDDQQSLDFYTLKRNTAFKLMSERDRYLAFIKEVEGKIEKTLDILRPLEEQHPEYKSEWFAHYNKELAKRKIRGIPHPPGLVREYYERMNIKEIPESGELGAEAEPVIESFITTELAPHPPSHPSHPSYVHPPEKEDLQEKDC